MLEDLLRRFHGDGNAAAMEAVVRRTRGKLTAIARRIGAPQDAEDSVQAAYHALLCRAAAPVMVEAWLTTAVVRIAYRRKALARHELQLAETLARDGDPHVEASRREESSLLRQEIARLPTKYRDVLVLRWLEGLTVEETARLLDLPEATVKTHTRRGMALLRSRVAPWAAYAMLAGPWLLADSIRSAAGWGIFMNTKTTMTMAGVALVAGAVGLGVGANATTRDTSVRRREVARVVAREARIKPRDAAEVVRSRERPVHAERERTEVKAAAPNPVSKPGPTFEERYARAGRTLGVSAEALAAVTTAITALHEHQVKRSPQTMSAQSEALAALESYGGEACRAAIAHLRATDRPNTVYVPIMAATWQPGMERHLLELARDPGVTPKQREYAMRCLSLAGTSEVRNFLLAELEGAKNERLIAGAAQSLGWLKEKRAVPILERLLYRQGRDVMQGAILNGLGTLGSEEARRVLVEFVNKDHSTTLLLHAVRALQWSDTAAARTAARRILIGPHREKLTPNERLILEATAKP